MLSSVKIRTGISRRHFPFCCSHLQGCLSGLVGGFGAQDRERAVEFIQCDRHLIYHAEPLIVVKLCGVWMAKMIS